MEKCTAEEPDNLEMFSTPLTTRRGRGGGRSAGRGSTPRVGRGRGWSRRRSEDEEDTPDTSEEEDEEDFNEDDLDDEDEEDEEDEEGDDQEKPEQEEEEKQENGKDNSGKSEAELSKYTEQELYEDEDEETTGDGPHQEIVLTTSGAGDGALEFQLEQDGMVIPIEVVIDQNESTENTKNGEAMAEVIADGTKE